LALIMAFMVFCPVLVRVSERFGLESLARLLAYAGYTWMGLLFLFVCASLVLDVYRLGAMLISLPFEKGISAWVITQRTAFYLALLLSVCAGVYALLEANMIREEHITIADSKIPEAVGRIRIVQISDVHLGLIVREQRLEWILRKVREAAPDLLVSTGDLVDGQINDLSKMASMFRSVKTTYGKFAVTGNHEYYAGLERALSFTTAAGFRVLRGETASLQGLINIAGVDDPAGDRFGQESEVSEDSLLATLPREGFTLLLKHRPLVNQRSSGLFDLQLSGHAHKGQIFPFTLLIKLLYPIDAGLLRREGGGDLYVSRGSGTWGPPMRFLAPPEVTVIDLVHAESPGVQME
ncbi:MAG: metallophosphoesterase, partial [Desulfatiglandales bacterium]